MISISDWWSGLANYNRAIFPFQLVVMLLGIVLVLLLSFKPGKRSSNCMKVFLSLSMLFTGTMFFIVLGVKLPAPLKYFQGALFIAIGLFLLVDTIAGWSELSLPTAGNQKRITYFLLALVLIYPIIGLLRGHDYTQLIYPGTVPCGSTAFALVILSASLPNVKKIPCILLLVWAIPFAPLIQIPQFKVYEDIIMFIVGIYALIRLVQYSLKKKVKEA